MTHDYARLDYLFPGQLGYAQEHAALVSNEGAWTVGDLVSAIDKVALALRRRGVKRGHRIAILLPTGPMAVATLLGALRVGGFVALLSNSLGPGARQYRLNAFRPNVIIDPDHSPEDTDTVAASPSSPIDAGRVLLWTSGSTGLPRGIVLDWGGVLWNARTNACAVGLRATDRALVLLDGAYCYALVHQILSHFVVGGSVAIPPQPAWLEATGRLIERFEPTNVAVVPSILRVLLSLPRLYAPLRRLRFITIGGAAADEALLMRAQRIMPDVQLVVTYGLTEAGPRVATRFFRVDEKEAPGNVGHALPGVDLRVAKNGQIFRA